VARTIEGDVARTTRDAEPERPQERLTAEFLRQTREFEALANDLLERCPADLAELAENERQRREREERREAVQVRLRLVEDALEAARTRVVRSLRTLRAADPCRGDRGAAPHAPVRSSRGGLTAGTSGSGPLPAGR
jgi:hypothetical protein